MGRNLLLATLQTPTRQITVGTFHLESVFFPRVKEAEDLKESQLKYIYAISPMNSILMGDTNLTMPLSQRGIPPNTDTTSSPYIIDVGEEYVISHDYDVHSNSPPDVYSDSPPDVHSDSPLDVHSDSPPDVHSLGVCPFSKGAGGSPFSKGAGGSPFSKGAGSSPFSKGAGGSPFSKGAGAGAGAATYCGRTNKHVKNKSIQSRLDRIYVKIKRNTLKVHFYGLTGTVTQPSDHYGVFTQLEF